MITIRHFREEDYEPIVAIYNVVYPEYPESVKDWRFWDSTREDRLCYQRYVVEKDGQLIGYASRGCSSWMFDPHKFHVQFSVHPAHRQQGIGAMLYEHVLADIARYNPVLLRTDTREDMAYSLNFLHKRGFVEEGREWESRLNPAGFDHTPYTTLEDNLTANGITIKTLTTLKQTDPDYVRKIYDVDWATSQDIPSPEPLTKPDFATFCKKMFDDPNALSDAVWVALDGSDYVGITSLWKISDPTQLEVGFTGVVRAYRRRGIALTLKLRSVAYAQAHGNPSIKTWNDSLNDPMLAINNRLGFVRQPAWISFKKIM